MDNQNANRTNKPKKNIKFSRFISYPTFVSLIVYCEYKPNDFIIEYY